MFLRKVKLHWFVDQLRGSFVVSTRFESERAAADYAAATGGRVRTPLEAQGGFGEVLFSALNRAKGEVCR